jgi:uncharacterized repeat protein (TIGR01451 family)
MPQRHSPVALLCASTTLALTGAFAAAAPAAQAATGTYSGSASGDLVHLNAINIPGQINVADATIAPVTASVSTEASPRARAHATNIHANLLSGAIDQNLVVEAEQNAPPDHATGVHDELLNVPADPLLNATVTSADAHSRWLGDGVCVTNGPISSAISRVAEAAVLPGTPGTIELTNSADPDGAVVTSSSTRLVKQPANAANYAVRSASSTQITSLSLLAGQVVVEVVTAPKVIATATGVAGTSTVTVTQPVLKVTLAGTTTTLLAGEDLAPINIPGLPVIELTAGNVTKSIASNGTTAQGSGNLLTLKLLSVPGTFEGVTLTVGDVFAKATAPVGGVNCAQEDPLRESRKDASAATVNAGKTFDYTVTVPNRGSSDLTNVVVRDTVSGSPALVLVSSTPAPTSHSGNTYVFSLGTIAPNQVKTISMTFRVPSGADVGTKYSNTAVITGTYAGQKITRTVHTPYPTVDGPGIGPCDLSRSTKFASHIKVRHGETFTYYVNVFNQGGQACTGIEIKDALTNGVRFVSCTDGCTHSGQLVTWKISSLAAGASRQLAVTVLTVANSGTLPNAADITPDSGTGGTPRTPGPTVTNVSVLSPSHPATRGDSAFPRTGGSPALALLGLVLLGTALAVRRRVLV